MSGEDEHETRSRLDAYLTKLARPNRTGKQTRRAKAVKAAKAGIGKHNVRRHRERKRNLKVAATLASAPTVPHYDRRNPVFSLLDLLVMRTDGAKWYTFAQLRALLPETTTSGVKAIVFQRGPRRGVVERVPLVEFPDAPWLSAETLADRARLASKPKYRYRIGAEIDTERVRLRERWRAYGEVARDDENA